MHINLYNLGIRFLGSMALFLVVYYNFWKALGWLIERMF